MANEENEQWICTALDVEGGIRPGSPIKPVMRGVAAKDKRWPAGTTLNVCFLDGDPGKHNQFMNIAKAWFLDGVSLKLDQTNDISKSHIRVTFGRVNKSYIGTQSNDHRGQWTLTVSDVTPDRVLHEFGHALGLVHEYCHPNANIQWNKEVVYSDFAGYKKPWDKATVDKWVFEQFDSSKEVITNFDIASVMIYPIRKNWTTDGKTREVPMKLSEGDKATIRQLYPA